MFGAEEEAPASTYRAVPSRLSAPGPPQEHPYHHCHIRCHSFLLSCLLFSFLQAPLRAACHLSMAASVAC